MAARQNANHYSPFEMANELEEMSSQNEGTFPVLLFYQMVPRFPHWTCSVPSRTSGCTLGFCIAPDVHLKTRQPLDSASELRKTDSNNLSARSTYQPVHGPSYDRTYDPNYNSRCEPHPKPNYSSPLHSEYNPITCKSSNRAPSQISSSGRSAGYRTSDTEIPYRKRSTGNQQREPIAIDDSRDSKDDTRRVKGSDAPQHKKSPSRREKGSGRHKHATKDRDRKHDRDE
ncbi:hypothetical protein N7G274_008963 [Stereocaulon virgatum]|uniref:Uncharacterized protein n=1 Tax=Stereocaulon virgatum TaxID=373712 RepID=A0ABR4A0K2_9LECA